MITVSPPSTLRLAIVLSHPTQYYSPWFRWLRAHTAFEFRVFYLWDFGVRSTLDPQFKSTFSWDVDLLSGYGSEFVPNTSTKPGTHRFFGLRNPDLTRRLEGWRPDAVLLFGYKSLSHLAVIAWARLHRVPLVFRGDSHLIGRGQLPLLHRTLLRSLYAQCAAVTFVGEANRDYFTRLGVPAHKLFFAPHSVNTALFDPARLEHRAAAGELRCKLGLAASTRVVLYAGKFVAAKQPCELLEAFLKVRPRDTAIVFVGDGEEKPALFELARTAPPGTVHFLPFANQSEMPSRYLLADLFALPSRGHYETWGLAVNEAMHLGVPCLVSDRVGCQRDLVTDGKTGWVFAATDPAALPVALARALAALSSDGTREKFRRAGAARIAGYTYAQTTDGLLAALASVSPSP